MRNLTIAAALLLGSTSALAQTAQPTSVTPTGTMTPQAAASGSTAVLAGEAPTTSTTPPTNSPTAIGMPATARGADAALPGGADPTVAAPAPTAVTTATGARVVADGALTPLDFAMHLESASGARAEAARRDRTSRAPGNEAIRLLNATAADFSKADRNGDRQIDPTELAAWSGGAAPTSGAGTTTPMPAQSGVATPPAGTTAVPSDATLSPDGQVVDTRLDPVNPPQD